MRVETRDPLIGTVLDRRFRIDERVASGGFGVIYSATHVRSGYQVALKVLHPAMSSDPDMVARFRLEAATLTTLRNPHTVTTYELVEANGMLFMVMELLRGESLLQRFRRLGVLPWKSVVAIGRAVCDSLAEAHALGVVHRDLKPENIHLEPQPAEDFVKVLDFGIAKLMQGGAEITKHNEVVGTFDYVSPEQVANEAYTGRSDIYTLGVVMYEMLTGSRPFGHATGAALLATILTTAPTAPSIRLPGLPPALDAVILRCLEKDPAGRFADVGALAVALDKLLDQPRDEGVITRRLQLEAEEATRVIRRPPSVAGSDGPTVRSPPPKIPPPYATPHSIQAQDIEGRTIQGQPPPAAPSRAVAVVAPPPMVAPPPPPPASGGPNPAGHPLARPQAPFTTLEGWAPAPAPIPPTRPSHQPTYSLSSQVAREDLIRRIMLISALVVVAIAVGVVVALL
jgi:serine/threonine protein kinase